MRREGQRAAAARCSRSTTWQFQRNCIQINIRYIDTSTCEYFHARLSLSPSLCLRYICSHAAFMSDKLRHLRTPPLPPHSPSLALATPHPPVDFYDSDIERWSGMRGSRASDHDDESLEGEGVGFLQGLEPDSSSYTRRLSISFNAVAESVRCPPSSPPPLPPPAFPPSKRIRVSAVSCVLPFACFSFVLPPTSAIRAPTAHAGHPRHIAHASEQHSRGGHGADDESQGGRQQQASRR